MSTHQEFLQRLQRERPHTSQVYNYKRFLTHIIPRLQTIESRSPLLQFYFVFVSYDHEDYLDFWSRTPHIVSLLNDMAESHGIPKEDLFDKVYVYSHSRNAHNQIIDDLRLERMTNMSGNLDIQTRKTRANKHKLKLLNTLSRPQLRLEFQHPRTAALNAVSRIRDPNVSARIAASHEENPEAAGIIANVTRREIRRNRANAARTARANATRTNTPGLPKNITRNILYSYMFPSRAMTPAIYSHRMRNSRTANVRPMHLDRLFVEGNEENHAH
jgi:hypothetical protein